ncbi:alpha/beta fold hydrolase [Streptomyces sp. NPDC059698]|uniref:alpha/beta fold hydrolase n=1 Tax=unclassified Streptomyces TaxID=2593676 RepID=UPI00094009A1|nr:alpha/beta fold hydrolase [Streptomyces sp. CB02366]
MVDLHAVDAEGIRLAHRASEPPEAPPLVLSHARGEDAADWDVVAPVLARSRRVHALDLRGHGRSDRPRDCPPQLMRDDELPLRNG